MSAKENKAWLSQEVEMCIFLGETELSDVLKACASEEDRKIREDTMK